MNKIKELREQSSAELKVLGAELRAELFALKCESNMQKKLEKPHLVKAKRRQRARVLTLLKEKEKEA